MPTDSQNIDKKSEGSKRKAVSYGMGAQPSAQKNDSKVVPYKSGARAAASVRARSRTGERSASLDASKTPAGSKSSRASRNSAGFDDKKGSKRSNEHKSEKSSRGRKSSSTTKRHATKEQVKEEKQGRRSKHAHDAKTEQKGFKGLLVRAGEIFADMNLAMRVLLLVVVLAIAAAAILYPIGCTYYQAMRQEQRYQAELDAVNARNDALKEENDSLKTDEGVENQARKDLGWVKDGEQAVIISNSNENSESEMPNQVDSDDIHAPRTWYYDILDVIFQSNV